MHNKSEAYQGPKYFSYNGKGVFASGSGSSSDDVRNLSLWHIVPLTGDDLEVLAPDGFRERIAEKIKVMNQRYFKDKNE